MFYHLSHLDLFIHYIRATFLQYDEVREFKQMFVCGELEKLVIIYTYIYILLFINIMMVESKGFY